MRNRVLALVVFTALHCGAAAAQEAKNVILFIGDGLGATQTALALQFGRLVSGRETHMEELMGHGNSGYTLALPLGTPVTDSAAAATQIATGKRGRNESIGLGVDGHPNETLLEWAEARGMRTGLVSNMRLSHATPAAFASHVISRYEPESVIFDQILVEHEIDVLLGGGARALVPEGTKVSTALPGIVSALDGESNRTDSRDRIEEARARGYTVVSNRARLLSEARASEKLLGMFSASHLPYVLDSRASEIEVPSLAELVRSALDVLGDSDEGFLLVVEGGRIDYAGHDNDAGAMLHEMFDFDAALGVGAEYQRRNPDTLVVVTADHGTGGFSFTYGELEPVPPKALAAGVVYAPRHNYPSREQFMRLHAQSASYVYLLDEADGDARRLIDAVKRYVGVELTREEAEDVLETDANGDAWLEDFAPFYSDPESNPACRLARVMARHTFVVWSTGGHTTEPVLSYGVGPGAERLRGVHENVDLYHFMRRALEGR